MEKQYYQLNGANWLICQINEKQFETITAYKHTQTIGLDSGNVIKYLECGCSIRNISEHTYNRFRRYVLAKIMNNV